MKKLRDINKVFKDLETKKNNFFKHRFHKYIVTYEIEDDNIKVYSNIGNYRKVANTHSNLNKINKAIVKNKIDIINRIEEYEKGSHERIMVLLLNILLVCGTGASIPFVFFMGSIELLLFACLTFSISVITTTLSGVEYYVLANEIQNLKEITGYKIENEFKLPTINLKSIKNK